MYRIYVLVTSIFLQQINFSLASWSLQFTGDARGENVKIYGLNRTGRELKEN